jgi:AraC family transcriptional regulator
METIERILYQSPLVAIGEFACPPQSPRWHEPNTIIGGPFAVFPHRSVVIQHAGQEPVLANPNHVVFYNAGETYRRRLHDERGSRCLFVAPRGPLLDELTVGRGEFPFGHGPGAADAYVVQHAVHRHLLESPAVDQLFVEEAITQAVARATADAGEQAGRRRRAARRETTSGLHRATVEEAKSLLTGDVATNTSLARLAERLHASPFHLARMFRAHTGFSLHGYRKQLRLRLALEQLQDRELDLSTIAHRLGFASHSHFTDSFRRAFGIPPSAARSL